MSEQCLSEEKARNHATLAISEDVTVYLIISH